MDFYCERLKENVDSDRCKDECNDFQDCKQSGYFNEVHRDLGISSKTTRIQALTKMCQRAMDPEYVDLNKEESSLLILTGTWLNEPSDITNEELNRILGVLPVSPNDRLIEGIKQATRDYLSNKALWESMPSYGECKGILKNIHNLSDELAKNINKLVELTLESHGIRTILSQLLRNDDEDLFKLLKGVNSIHNATSEILSDEEGALQKNLPNMPLILLIRRLNGMFEETTRKRAAISLYESQKPGTDLSLSEFLKFVYTFLEVVDPKAIR